MSSASQERKKLSFNPKVDTFNIPPPTEDELPEMPSFSRKANSNPPFRRMSVGVPAMAVKTTTTPNNTPKSASPAPTSGGSKQPEWFEDLTDNQISMFKEVFELLDKDGGGTINAEELYIALKDLDTGIDQEEIEAVLGELDKDGNGEIDFDEFLYAMCMTDKFIDNLSGSADAMSSAQYSKRQRLFFSAITQFAVKNSLSEIERYYANKARQAPHVISFYTAGARLIGLNDRQLEQELKRLQKASKNQDSPYAKLPFMTGRPKPSKKRNNKRSPRTARIDTSDISEHTEKTEQTATTGTNDASLSIGFTEDEEVEEEDVMSLEEEQRMLGLLRRAAGKDNRRENVQADDLKEITSLLKELADSGSVVARLPDVHLVQAIRTKLDTGDKQMLCSSLRKARQIAKTNQNTSHNSSSKTPKSRGASGSSKPSKPSGWRIPKMTQRHFDMPTIPMDARHGKVLTIEDVPYIRQKVSKALGLYYGKVQNCHIKTAWNHWDNLNVGTIKSGKLKENFRKVYMAYSPHKEENVFVIAPWIPGPRYTSACAGKPTTTYAPTPRPHSTGLPIRYGSMSRMSSRSGRASTVMH